MQHLKKAKIKKGMTVLVRADFNVPIQNNKVIGAFRIIKTLPTIQFLLKKGVKVILISHAGDDGSQSLEPVYQVLKKYIPVMFVPAVFGVTVEQVLLGQKPGTAILLENLRSEGGEKKNDQTFAKALASYADMYVNDAFPVSHRVQASIVSIPKYLPSYAGFQLDTEVRELSRAHKPTHPFLFILGGNKFSTKMPLIKKFAKTADHFFIGGALLNNLLLAKGYEIGMSVHEVGYDVSSVLKNKKLILPIDLVVSKGKKVRICSPYEVKHDEAIVDVGPETIKYVISVAGISKFVLWNGPVGYYDFTYTPGTQNLVKGLSKVKADVLIGGGDTVAVISKCKLEDKFTFVSTGGGATLDFLSDGTLPGIKALK